VSVFKSSQHTYAQAISDETGRTLAASSTREKQVMEEAAGLKVEELKTPARSTKSISAALAVGLALGRKLLEKEIKQAVFDRNGFVYHGRVKYVAEGMRKAGVKI